MLPIAELLAFRSRVVPAISGVAGNKPLSRETEA